ncbi:MAG: ferredoxin reductase [Actinomycetota bacterium]
MARAALLRRLTLAIDGPVAPAPGRWVPARLVARRAETQSAATLVFEADAAGQSDGRAWLRHRAGQHVDVRLTAEDGYQAERSYSIASAPEDPMLELTVERLDDGEVSLYLMEDMVLGDLLELRGPIGGWFVWDVRDGGPLLLIAGGSGLVPLMAMLRHRHRQRSTVPTRLLVSVRTAEELLYASELAELACAGDGFELFVTVTRGGPLNGSTPMSPTPMSPAPGGPAPSGPGMAGSGLGGRINAAMLSQIAWPAADRPRAYVCGPTSFVETATGLLVDLGYPAKSVRAERFGPSGTIDVGPAV